MSAHPRPPDPTVSGGEARPGWMSALSIACAATLVFGVVRDLAFAPSRDVEVWFGFEVTGRLAQLTAPLHWAIFAVGAWAFWKDRTWVVPWAAAYLFYAAFSHLVWSEASVNGRGWPIGLVQALCISVFGVLLLRAGRRLARPNAPARGVS